MEMVEPEIGLFIKEEAVEEFSDAAREIVPNLHPPDSSQIKISCELVELLIKTTITCANYFDDLCVRSFLNPFCHGSFAVIVTRVNHAFFPSVPISPDWPENRKKEEQECLRTLERSELNLVVDPFRLVISGTTLKASLQVNGVEKQSVPDVIQFTDGVWKVSEKILPLLNVVSEKGLYNVCSGYTAEELNLTTDDYVKPQSLVTRNSPFLRYESRNCSYVLPSQNVRDRCKECLKWLNQQKRYKITQAVRTQKAKTSKTEVSSRTAFIRLTPNEQKVRFGEIQKERKVLQQKVRSLEAKLRRLEMKVCGVKHDNDIPDNDDDLDDIINEPIPDDIDDIINKLYPDDDEIDDVLELPQEFNYQKQKKK